MAEALSQKVLQYEEFVNERLRHDLEKVLSQREEVCGEIAEYNQLKMTLELITAQEGAKPLKTMVDLGCNFYAHAKVEDPSMIFVAIGLGFHLEMRLDEAIEFIDGKVTRLAERSSKLSDQAALINGRIKLVMETLRELQFSSTNT